MSRTTTFRGESYKVIGYPLTQIIGTDNCRRPCSILWNLGLDPWVAFRQIISGDIEQVRQGVALLEQSPRFCEMSGSIGSSIGQLQAIGLRSYRVSVGKNANNEKEYQERAGLSFGNGRLFAVALLEGQRQIAVFDGVEIDGKKANKTPLTVDAIVMKLTRDESYELSVVENDQRTEMDDLDWGFDFDRLLKSINPTTKKSYTIKEVAEKRRKNYCWVRGRAALPYLPVEMLKEITDWNKVNISALCELALTYKAGAQQQIDQGEEPTQSAPTPIKTGPILVTMPFEEGDNSVNETVELPEFKVPESKLPIQVQPKKRRTVMNLSEMGVLFSQQTNDVAKEAIAQCMKMTLEEVETYIEEKM